jgi:teichoic acid transport system ATP-binding protein
MEAYLMLKPKVIFDNVSKKYSLFQTKKEKLFSIFSSQNKNNDFYALRNISFQINEGETIGVIGINGSGKSTLSSLLAQVIPPSSGNIKINGETSLIAISAGLNNNLTGMENIDLKCLMHGLTKDGIKKVKAEIIEFADIGVFINQPVKNYSSGMKSRLGFAISIHTNPDVLVVDEALSVGDQTFYEKCIKKMNKFKEEGKTIFFVSHSISQVKTFCDKVMWIHYGQIEEIGDCPTVIANYQKFIKWFNGLSDDEKKIYKQEKLTAQKEEGHIRVKTTESERRRRRSKARKNNLKKFYGEVFLLLAIVFLSSIIMFKNDFSSTSDFGNFVKKELNIASSSNNKKVNPLEDKSVENKKINKIGFVINDKADIFKSQDLKKPIANLEFLESVSVKNKINNIYKINAGKYSGYINKSDVSFENPFNGPNELDITDFIPVFPPAFQNSYEYFLAFLNTGSSEIESKLSGKTAESTDKKGNRVLEYGNIQYRINENNYSDEIILRNVDFNQAIDLLGKANVKSSNGNSSYFSLKNYNLFINIKDKVIIINEKVTLN